MQHRNLVVAPCGNKSFLFQQSWLKEKQHKNFDLCLLFYHDAINKPELYGEADFFYHLKGFKYHMLHKLFTEIHPEWLTQYDYFYFPDDDIDIDTASIKRLFELSLAFDIEIAQAALSADSFCSWPMFKATKNCFCRFVGQIEVMAPLFKRSALQKCLPSFIGNRSSWGVDSVWSHLLGYPEDKLLVFDSVIMRHTLPVGGGELYEKIGVNPHDEWKAITTNFGARLHNYREYGRLSLVNKNAHRFQYLRLQTIAFFVKKRKDWRDYDLNSRVKNKVHKLFKK